jgi:hypothetical protein
VTVFEDERVPLADGLVREPELPEPPELLELPALAVEPLEPVEPVEPVPDEPDTIAGWAPTVAAGPAVEVW